ncbi:hypothetical protein AAG570_013960 [Ranatra chinensis]|uniref:C2H2-type domain-containing protein n=1 Tax=Ranatra chinensis TaxID=642074 RepID=A0ABD0Z1Y9_9HEMI
MICHWSTATTSTSVNDLQSVAEHEPWSGRWSPRCTVAATKMTGGYQCGGCGKWYKHQRNFSRHTKYECPKGASRERRFNCSHCSYSAKRRDHLVVHNVAKHLQNLDCQTPLTYPSNEQLIFCDPETGNNKQT